MAKNIAQFTVEQFLAFLEALAGPNGTCPHPWQCDDTIM